MAQRFWVGGTGTADAVTTTQWSATSGGAGGASVPVAADDVNFDGSSGGGMVTIGFAYNPSWNSITMGAFTGTLDFSVNNNSPTIGTFSGTGTATRALNMGSGTWTITASGSSWVMTTVTGLTFNANTSNLVFTDSSATAKTTSFGGLTMFNVRYAAGSGTLNLQISCNDLSFAGYTGVMSLTTSATNVAGNLTLGVGQGTIVGSQNFNLTASGSVNITSNGTTIDRSMTLNGTGSWTLVDNLIMGTTRQLTLTAGTFNANNKNLSIGTFSSSNSSVRALNMGNGTWTLTGNNVTIWSTATTTNMTFSGTATIVCSYSGSVGTRTFSPGGVGIFDQNTGTLQINGGTDIFTITGTSAGFYAVDFTGFAGTFTPSSTTINIRTSLTMGSGMTNSYTGAFNFNGTTGTGTITSNGIQFASAFTFAGIGGTWQLGDNFVTTSTITLTNGTLNANTHNLTGTAFALGSGTKTLTMSSGIWTMAGTGTVWNTNTNNSGYTLNAGTSTLIISDTSATSKTIRVHTDAMWNLRFNGGTGILIMGATTTDSPSWNNINFTVAPSSVQFFAGSTTTVATLTWKGAVANLITLASTTGGTAWNLICASGVINCDYLSLQDSHASGGASFYAGAHSTNVSGNTGWIFAAASIALTKSLSYTIKTNPSLTKSLTYDVRISTAIAKALTYLVKASPSLVKTLQYELKSSSAIPKALTYSLVRSIPLQLALQYLVYTPRVVGPYKLYTDPDFPITVELIQGNKNFQVQFSLKTSGTDFFDLTRLSARINAQAKSNPNVQFTTSMAVIGDPADGLVGWTIAEDDLIFADNYDAQIELRESSNDEVITFWDFTLAVGSSVPMAV